MQALLPHVQRLVYTLLDLMPTGYQRRSLEVLLSLFLQATGKPLPAYSELKSGSALSRFLNHYRWPVRQVIRSLRQAALERLLAPRRRGRRPILEIMVDLTCLEKAGRFKGLDQLIHVLNGKRGLQVVIVYLCVAGWRIPWGFRVWRGKGGQLTKRKKSYAKARDGFDLTAAVQGYCMRTMTCRRPGGAIDP
jgi:hypothetical protein